MDFDALIVVDVQKALIKENPANAESFIEKVKALIKLFRENKRPVIFVRHDDGRGTPLEYGTEGFQIYKETAPNAKEKVITKRFNSAFRGTELKTALDEIGAKKIVICGMQTQYCIDTTVKVAFEYGYDVTIVSGSVTTVDGPLLPAQTINDYYESEIWNKRFANVVKSIS